MIVLCRFSSIYLSSGPGMEAEVRVKAQKMASVDLKVLLLLVAASPVLRWVRGLFIWLVGFKGIYKTFFFLNRLAEPLGLKLLKL